MGGRGITSKDYHPRTTSQRTIRDKNARRRQAQIELSEERCDDGGALLVIAWGCDQPVRLWKRWWRASSARESGVIVWNTDDVGAVEMVVAAEELIEGGRENGRQCVVVEGCAWCGGGWLAVVMLSSGR
ncbi:hypothetical protein Tco_0760801 [Tanacetum coccineum]